MKTREKKIDNYEQIMSEIVLIVGNSFDNEKLTHYECIGVFESAKQLFIDIQNRREEEEHEN
jgi:hypothetical protein